MGYELYTVTLSLYAGNQCVSTRLMVETMGIHLKSYSPSAFYCCCIILHRKCVHCLRNMVWKNVKKLLCSGATHGFIYLISASDSEAGSIVVHP